MRIVLAGDLMISARLAESAEWDHLHWVRSILADADAAFANFESVVHDYQWPPMATSGGTWTRTPVRACRDVAEMGFSLLSLANNHAADYGWPGLSNTIESLTNAGLVCAGAGPDLSAARRARFVDTRAGRVGLVAAATTAPDHAHAEDGSGPVRARPGVQGIRHGTAFSVPRDAFAALTTIARRLGAQVSDTRIRLATHDGVVEIALGDSMRRTELVDAATLQPLIDTISRARAECDVLIVSLHSHEAAPGGAGPAAFVELICRQMIDAGADLIAGHGPHQLRHIEIHNGKPIFYGLGSLILQTHQGPAQPRSAFHSLGVPVGDTAALLRRRYEHLVDDPYAWTTTLAEVTFESGRLDGIRLIPAVVETNPDRPLLGMPRPFADSPLSGSDIDRIKTLVAQAGVSSTVELTDGLSALRIDPNKNPDGCITHTDNPQEQPFVTG